MRLKLLSASVAALAAACAVAAPVRAATIILHNLGGVEPGTFAYQGFTTAANFWAHEIANPITIRLDVGFGHLGPHILGSTGSSGAYVPTALIEQQMVATGTSSIDAVASAHLPALSASGGISMITPGYNNPDGTGVDVSKLVYDHNDTFNNQALFENTATLKALGFSGFGSAADGSVTFSSDFDFDFNAKNGIRGGAIDFLSVATHEIGHALGFVSGVDIYDLLGGNGPLASGNEDICGVDCHDYPAQDDAFSSSLDLFRYSANPDGVDGTTGPTLTWAPGVESYFSIDGGATNLGNFSTGAFNGDTWQASHWKAPTAPPFCAGLLGIMNPYICRGLGGVVTNLDFEAFDAMGYNLSFDPGTDPHNLTTNDISRQFGPPAIPEPATWALLLMGFGFAGAAVRRRRALAA
jgi:hypothetical protein